MGWPVRRSHPGSERVFVIYTATDITGAFLVDVEPDIDKRGFFARTFCAKEFAKHGLNPVLVQASISSTRHRGTLRGLHYQVTPYEEDKLVRCTHGSIFDVIVDLRPHSTTYLRRFVAVLRADEQGALYVPKGCAHGFQALEDDTQVLYQMSEPYVPEGGRGVRWNDPVFGVDWPIADPILHPRDAAYPDFEPVA